MLYWECKSRLAVLREFRVRAVDYFENIEPSGWMAGGAPRPMNATAQKARHDMNRMLGDVLVSLSRFSIPHVVYYQPPPRLGGYPQNVDIILNVFSLWEFQVGSERVFDTIDRAIGTYERECKKLFRKLFNPLYWLGMLLVQFLRIPSKLRGAGAADVPGTDPSLFGSMRQGWAGWNRTDRLALIAIIVAVILGGIALMSPEVRRALRLDKAVTARVDPSPAQVVPAPNTPPAQKVPAQAKPFRPNQGPVDHPAVNNTPPSISQNNSGGINVQQATTGENSPIVNSPITIGDTPKRIAANDLTAATQYLFNAKNKAHIVIKNAQNSNSGLFARDIYKAFKDAGWPMVETGVDDVILFKAPGNTFLGAVVTAKGPSLRAGEQTTVREPEPLFYVGTILRALKVPVELNRDPNQKDDDLIMIQFEGLPN